MNFDKANEINFKKEFAVTTPYPEITVTNLPENILIMLKRVYAGSKSEFTSLTQYIYQHFILWKEANVENISHTMEEIAIKEMQHYEMLAKILLKSKVDPKNCVYIDGNRNICDYWKANSVNYSKALTSMMEENIKLESIAIREYNEILFATTNENLKEILLRIIEDEDSHLAYFNALLEVLKN